MSTVRVNMQQFRNRFEVYADNVDIFESIIEGEGTVVTLDARKLIDVLTGFNIFFTVTPC